MAFTVGTGSTFTLGTTTTFAPLITNISSGNGPSRPSLQTSNLATTGYHTFVPGELIDGGTVTIDFWLDSAAANTWPPITVAAAETVTIYCGAATTVPKITFSGFCESWDFDIPLEDGITGTATFKVAGTITLSAT